MGYVVYAVHRCATPRGAPLCQNKSLNIFFNKAFKIFEKGHLLKDHFCLAF